MRLAPQELRTYFVTTVTANRRRLFQVETTAALMLDVLQTNREKGRLSMHSFVVMPDHIHLLMTPAYDVSLEKAVQFVKGGFSFRLRSKLDVWERGSNETQIRDAEKFEACRRYIEQNPVRKGYVASAEMFPFSSAAHAEMVDERPQWFGETTRG